MYYVGEAQKYRLSFFGGGPIVFQCFVHFFNISYWGKQLQIARRLVMVVSRWMWVGISMEK